MDDNTRFLVERIDNQVSHLREEISALRDKIDSLQGFKNKILGASMIVSGMVSVAVEYFSGKGH